MVRFKRNSEHFLVKIHKAWKLAVQHDKYKSSKDKLLSEFAPRLNLKDAYLCCSCALCPTQEQSVLIQDAQSAPAAEPIDWDNIPRMPRQNPKSNQQKQDAHRPKIPDFDPGCQIRPLCRAAEKLPKLRSHTMAIRRKWRAEKIPASSRYQWF